MEGEDVVPAARPGEVGQVPEQRLEGGAQGVQVHDPGDLRASGWEPVLPPSTLASSLATLL